MEQEAQGTAPTEEPTVPRTEGSDTSPAESPDGPTTPTADEILTAAAASDPDQAPAAVDADPVADVDPVADAGARTIAEAAPPEATAEDAPPEATTEPAAEAMTAEAAPSEAAAAPPADGRPEPTTMDELLGGPDAEIRSFKHGDVVEGTVVRIDKDEILVDIGAKSEGVVSNRELAGRHAEAPPALKLGDTVLVYVMQPESDEGHVVLSLRRAGLERKWRAMQEQFEAGVIIEAPVIDHNKGGLIVDCGIRGFIPISQIVDFPRRPQNDQPRDAAQEIAEKLQPFVGRRLRLKILEVNRKANRLILSEKVALYEERREKRDELFSSLQVGQKVKGIVRSIAPFGVFVDLGGIDGLVHKSELSWNKVNNPEAGYKVGDEVEAEVIDINHERGRISLSIRRLQPDPWHTTVADYKVGDVIEGTVTKLVNFGAFVRVRDGLEGLIHISELSHARVTHPSDVVREGQTLKLKIISLESERHRLGLSLKQAEEAPPRVERERERERRPRTQREYAPSDAVQEPEGGIDNTLAAAFAQVREQMAATEQARAAAEATEAEPATAEAEPATAEAEPTSAEAEPTSAEAEPTSAEAEPTSGPATAETPEAIEGTAEAEATAAATSAAPEAQAEADAPPAEPAASESAAEATAETEAPEAPAAKPKSSRRAATKGAEAEKTGDQPETIGDEPETTG